MAKLITFLRYYIYRVPFIGHIASFSTFFYRAYSIVNLFSYFIAFQNILSLSFACQAFLGPIFVPAPLRFSGCQIMIILINSIQKISTKIITIFQPSPSGDNCRFSLKRQITGNWHTNWNYMRLSAYIRFLKEIKFILTLESRCLPGSGRRCSWYKNSA